MLGKRGWEIAIEGAKNPNIKTTPLTKIPSQANKVTPIQQAHQKHKKLDNRPYLDVVIYGKSFSGLLDSGASVTVMRDCPLIQQNATIEPSNVTLRAANKGFLPVIGQTCIPVAFNNKIIQIITVLVEDLEQDLLLGYDFWLAAELKIAYEPKEVLSLAPVLLRPIKTEIELEPHHQKQLQQAVGHFLITSEEFLGRTQMIEHEIELIEGAKPFLKRTHFYSPTVMKAIDEELQRMLKAKVIKPSSSPVASPVVPVKKPDGSVRLCLDSRQLNAITKRDQYPIPNPNHIFSRMEGTPYRSVIDLSKAFWQVPLSGRTISGQFASAQELTAFMVPTRGLYQFTVMPFGLSNAPATQCRLMDKVLGFDLEPRCTVYMDDILLTAKTIEEMIELIQEVAIRLRKSRLSINFEKSRFLAKSVKYLGYILDDRGLSADPERIKIMLEYPRPKNVKEVRRFLGLTGYYRRLILNYSGITSPLTNLLRKEVKRFMWTLGAEEAFQRLKKAMCEAPIIANPDFEKEFHIQCDASDVAGAAALGQKLDNGEEIIVAYFSHKWSPAEAKYGATEREAACVLFALRHFRDYIWGRPILVITDAQALTHVRTLKTEGSSRLARWAMELNEFDLKIKHRAGKLSAVPDALSRAVDVINVAQVAQDAWGQEMMNRIVQNPASLPDFEIRNNSLFKYETTTDDVGIVTYRWKEYVPLNSRSEVIKKIHEQLAHLGWEKCSPLIRRQFFWPKMVASIEKEIRSCDVCKSTKSAIQTTKVPMGVCRTANFPFQVIAIDHWGPAPRSRKGNTHLLVVVDVLTKYVLLHTSKNTNSEDVVEFLENGVFLRYGTPQRLISDNHQPLVGRNMVSLLNKYHVEHETIAAYHAQANPAERYIKTISAGIRAYLFQNHADHRKWDENIPKIERAINATRNETTGKTPFFAVFGREAILNGNEYENIRSQTSRAQITAHQHSQNFAGLRNEIKSHMEAAQQKYRTQYDKKAKPLTFQINERVWRKNRELSNAFQHFSQKLAPKYVPAKIVERLGQSTYKVKDEVGGVLHRIHANDLIKDFN